MDGSDGGGKRVDGTPVLGRQEGQADFAGREGDIRVRDPRCEMDRRRCEGVVRWDGDPEVPEAACS